MNATGIVVAKEGRTGTTMDFVGEEGDRALYVDPGVNDNIRLNEIDVDYVRETCFLHLTSFVGETSFQSQIGLVQQLPEHVLVSLDPGMFYANRGLTSLAPIVRRAFTVLPNATELKLLTGKEYRDGAQKLIEAGVKVVGVKLGKQGCYVTDGRENVATREELDKIIGFVNYHNIVVHTIGVATEEGGKLPGLDIVSTVDESMLMYISNSTGGNYYRATTPEELTGAYEAITKIEETKVPMRLAMPFMLLAMIIIGP